MTEKLPYWQSTKCPIKKRGVPPKYTKLTEEQIRNIILMYETGNYNYKQVAEYFNRHLSTISDVLNKRGFKAKSQSELQRKYSINESFFDDIDTEQKAYFLGFLYADGYNSIDRHSITVTVSSKDIALLEAFNSLIGSNKSIKNFSGVTGTGKLMDYSSLIFNGKKISNRLAELGCMQKKSFKIKFPKFIDNDYINHFIRGYFDGDGSFHVSKKIKSNMILSITSNKIFLNGLQDFLISKLGLSKTKINTASKSNEDIGVMCYSGRNNCVKIRDFMYKNSTIFLQRKFDNMYSI